MSTNKTKHDYMCEVLWAVLIMKLKIKYPTLDHVDSDSAYTCKL